MSTTSKVTLLAITGAAAYSVYFVHKQQDEERVRLRLGVIRDEERQERKRKNIEELKEQQRLQEYLSSKQNIESDK